MNRIENEPRRGRVALIAMLLLPMGGCASTRDFSIAGPEPLIPASSFEEIDLPSLIDPRFAKKPTGESAEEYSVRLKSSIEAFYNAPAADLELRRDRIQDMLLAASEQAFSDYVQYLQHKKSKWNFIFGDLTTGFAAAATVVHHELTAKILAASAALFSGIRSEWNQDYLSNLSIEVIVAGMTQRREDILKSIHKSRGGGDASIVGIRTYTLEAAIRDALLYHGAANLVTGLQAAAAAAKIIGDPGVNRLTDLILENPLLSSVLKVDVGRAATRLADQSSDEAQAMVDGAKKLPDALSKIASAATKSTAAAATLKDAVKKLSDSDATTLKNLVAWADQWATASRKISGLVDAANQNPDFKPDTYEPLRVAFFKSVDDAKAAAADLRTLTESEKTAASALSEARAKYKAKLAALQLALEQLRNAVEKYKAAAAPVLDEVAKSATELSRSAPDAQSAEVKFLHDELAKERKNSPASDRQKNLEAVVAAYAGALDLVRSGLNAIGLEGTIQFLAGLAPGKE